MTTKTEQQPKPVVVTGPGLGLVWFIGFLYTIGYVHLTGWKILLGLVAWPYLLGTAGR